MPDTARQFVADAYPDERERAHAERWLGLLALQAVDGEPLTWLHSAEMVRSAAMRTREVTSGLLIAVMFIPGFFIVLASDRNHLVLAGLTLIAMWGSWSMSVRMRYEHRDAVFDIWKATDTYQAARRASLRRGVAWVPAGAVVGLVSAPPAMGLWVLVPVAGYCAGISVMAAERTGPFPLALLAELIFAAGWGERPRFAALLEDAAAREVVRAKGNGYEFREGLQPYFAGLGAAALAERKKGAIARLSSPIGLRILAAEAAAARASHDAAAGAVIATILVGAAILKFYGNLSHYWWVLVFPAAAVAGTVWGVTYLGLRGMAILILRTIAFVPTWTRGFRLWLATVLILCAVIVLVGAGPALASIAVFCLPAAFVALCGGWACAMAGRRWKRRIPDAIAVATVAAALLVLVRPSLLSADPAAGLLFPVAAWIAIRVWRTMAASRRPAISVAANLVGSLLLGADLVLLLVWLANVLRLSVPVVATLRWYLEQVGSRADLPWWVWTGLYAVLAGASVAIAVRPNLDKAMWRRLVPATDLTQKLLVSVHVGLLVIVLVGLAAPPAVGPVLKRHLSAAYQVALQREFDSAAELSAYQAIVRQFHATSSHQTLAALVVKVHDVTGGGTTSSEADLAHRVGQMQATALALPLVPPDLAVTQGSASGGVTQRAAALARLNQTNDATNKHVEQVADLAAKLVASTLSIPSLSDSEVYQVVREYLSGLIESSRLTDVFTAWARHLPGARKPPAADSMLTPDPAKLKAAANATLTRQMVSDGLGDPATDPSAPSTAYQLAQQERPMDAAVDLVNQVRYLQAPSSGPCDGCAAPQIPVRIVADMVIWMGDFSQQPTEDRPGQEPDEEPVIHEP